MNIVCGTETSATIRWSPTAVPLPYLAECRWGGCNGHANRDRGPRWRFIVSNLFACPLNPLTPHSATQWGEECSGVNTVALVSVLQTRSSQMFVFTISKYFQHNAFITDVLSRLKITCLESERKEAKQQYQDHLQSYVRDSLGRPMEKLNVSKMFLAPLSWRLKVSYCRPSPSIVRCLLSVNFLHFHLLEENAWSDFNETWQESSLGMGHSKLFKWYQWPPWGPGGGPQGPNHVKF